MRVCRTLHPARTETSWSSQSSSQSRLASRFSIAISECGNIWRSQLQPECAVRQTMHHFEFQCFSFLQIFACCVSTWSAQKEPYLPLWVHRLPERLSVNYENARRSGTTIGGALEGLLRGVAQMRSQKIVRQSKGGRKVSARPWSRISNKRIGFCQRLLSTYHRANVLQGDSAFRSFCVARRCGWCSTGASQCIWRNVNLICLYKTCENGDYILWFWRIKTKILLGIWSAFYSSSVLVSGHYPQPFTDVFPLRGRFESGGSDVDRCSSIRLSRCRLQLFSRARYS